MFYLLVVLMAIVFFIGMVVFLSYNITKTTTDSVFPPVENKCPDFWLTDANGLCLVPSILVPDGNWGTFVGDKATKANQAPKTHGYQMNAGGDTINFKHAGWGASESSSLCNKKKWASTYGIHWDGVSNYSGVC